MEFIHTEIQAAQPTASSSGDSELVLKDGEQVDVNFVKKLESGLVLLNVKGKTVTVDVNNLPSSKTFTAVVTKTPDGATQFKFLAPLIEGAETTTTSRQSAQTPQSNQQIQTGQQPQTVAQTSVQTASGSQSNQQIQTSNQTNNQIQTNTNQSQTTQQTIKPDGQSMSQDIKTNNLNSQTGTATVRSSNVTVISQDASAQRTQAYAQASAVRQAEPVIIDGKTEAIKIPAGSIQVEDGENVEINLIKMQDNGKMLVSVKNTLFELKLEPQVFKSLIAQVSLKNHEIDLSLLRFPVEDLSPNYVKQQVQGFDIEKLMKAFGKFQHVDMQELTADKLKQALKDSGLSFENKLLNNTDVAGDEKFNALANTDTSAKDGITRMQVTNLFLASGLLAFLKTKDENVDDTLLRYKKDRNGNGTVYVSTTFSELGDTMIIIRSQSKNQYNISVKTETDISDMLSKLELENCNVHWYKFNKQDLELLDPKKDTAADMGSFEVII